MEPRKATLRVRLLPLKIKKLPINVEDRKQQNYQRKRENLKSDAAKYEEHKKADACNKRQSRKNMSDDQRKIYNEKAKLRMIKYRKTKVKQQKVITRREKEKQRRQWRESKQRHRLKMNAQQRRRENERRKQLYKETKSKVKRRINFFEQTTSTSTPKKKSATDIISEIHSSTPRTKEYLKQEGLINTPRTKSQIITDRKIVNHIKVSLKDMKKDRSRVGRSRYAWFVKNIARQAAKDFKMRQRLNLQYQFWIWATCYEPDMKDVMSERADGLPQSLKEEVSQFYYNEGEVLSCKSSVSSLGIQKVVLQSTVQQIYDKFVESSGAKLSFSAFRNLKPTECLTIDHNRFDACLCDICINVEFNIRALKHVATRHGTKLSVQNKYHANKKTLCPSDDFNDIHCTTRQCNNCGASALEIQLKEELSKALDVPVKWDKWENAVCPLTGKRRKLLVDHHGTTKECIEDLCQSQLPNLALHLFTSRWQRMQINILKKSPPQNCLISHVDFAENHRLIHQDQISSAFYNYNQATIHPSVLYYTCPNCTTSTVVEAMVFISSDLTHDAFAVHAFNQIMMDHVQNARGATISHHIQCSDRCSSQYISKKVFSIMTENEPSERIYFGSRHGKGVCDSLGGIIKNSADRFVKSRKGKIRTPKELYDFCNSHLIQDPTEEGKCVHKRRVFILVDNILRPEIKKELITLKGTQKMHHVKALQKDVVKARPFACFCEPCVSGNDEECVNKRCIGSTTWTEHVLDKTENRKRKSDKQMQCETEKKKQKPAKKNVTKQTPSRPSKSPIKTNRQTRSSSRQIVDKHQVNIQSSETETKTNTHENLREMSMCKTKRSLKLKVNKLMGSVEPFPVNKQLNIVDLSLTVDQMSLDLFPSDGPKDMYPVSVIGDGNCLSRCASLFGYYNQENYIDMKIRLSKEMIENADYYQRTYCNFAQYSEHNQPGMNTSNKKTVNAIYDKEVKAACTNGSYMGILHMAAYATVLGRTINSVYPIYGGHTVRKHLNTAIEPRTESTRNPVHIMWTNTTGKQQNENVWTPNHFVALLPLGPDVLVEDVQPTATTDDHALFDAEYLLRSPLDDEIFGVGDLPKAVLEGPDILEVGDIPEASLEGAKILGVGDIPLADLEGAEILGVCHIPDAALERAEMLGVGDIPDAILGLGDIPDAALERAEIFGLSDIPDAILGVGDMPDAALDGAQIFGVGDTDLPGAEILGAGDIPDAILGVGDIPDAILGVGDIPDAVLGVGDIPDAALKGAEIFGVGDIPDAILEVGDIPDAALEGAEILGVGDLPDAALEGAEILGVGEIPDAVLGVGDIPDAALKGAEIFGVGDIPDAILGVGDIPDAALEGAEIFGVGDIPDAVLGVGDIPDAALEGAEILGVGDLPDAALEGAEILGVGEIPDAVLGVGDIPDAALKGAEIFGVGDIPDAILGVGDLPDAALEGAEILGVGEIPDAILGVGDLPDAALEGAEILGVGDLPDAVLEGAEIHGVGEIPDAIFGVGDLPDAVLEGAEIFEVGDLPDAVLKAAEFLGVGDVPGLTLCDDGPVPEQKKQTRAADKSSNFVAAQEETKIVGRSEDIEEKPQRKPPTRGDFVVVHLSQGKHGKDYIAEILQIDSDEVHLSYMQRVGKGYRWPSKPDVSWESASSIRMTLQAPYLDEKLSSNRLQIFCFSDVFNNF